MRSTNTMDSSQTRGNPKTVNGKLSRSSLDEGEILRENIERDWIKCVKEKALHGKFFKYLN